MSFYTLFSPTFSADTEAKQFLVQNLVHVLAKFNVLQADTENVPEPQSILETTAIPSTSNETPKLDAAAPSPSMHTLAPVDGNNAGQEPSTPAPRQPTSPQQLSGNNPRPVPQKTAATATIPVENNFHYRITNHRNKNHNIPLHKMQMKLEANHHTSPMTLFLHTPVTMQISHQLHLNTLHPLLHPRFPLYPCRLSVGPGAVKMTPPLQTIKT